MELTKKKISAKSIIKAATGEYSYILSFIALCILGRVFNGKFFTWNNITNLFVQGSMIGIIAMGMTMVICAGLIDISVGSQVAFLGGFGILILNATGSVWAMLGFCVVAGCILGTINGLLVTKGGMPPMVATLAMMSAARAVINYYGATGPFTVAKSLFDSFRRLAVGGFTVAGLNVPYLMVIFIVISAIFGVVMKKTAFGKHVLAVGSNEKSARLSGINVDLTKTMTFVITGAMCGVASVMYASRMTAVASASAAQAWEMDAIAGVAIGGTSMTGGRGKILGTFLGVLMFKIINNILTAANISSYLNGAISAVIIIVAVLIQNVQNKKSA